MLSWSAATLWSKLKQFQCSIWQFVPVIDFGGWRGTRGLAETSPRTAGIWGFHFAWQGLGGTRYLGPPTYSAGRHKGLRCARPPAQAGGGGSWTRHCPHAPGSGGHWSSDSLIPLPAALSLGPWLGLGGLQTRQEPFSACLGVFSYKEKELYQMLETVSKK